MAVRNPRFEDLDLDPKLVEYIREAGGKVGPLKYIAEKRKEIPILRNFSRTGISFEEMKGRAKLNNRTYLVRSNNVCEFLPGTEGRFETVRVHEYDGPSDEILFNFAFKIPQCPSPHLKDQWPLEVKDLHFGVAEEDKADYHATVLEHPNQNGMFWATLSDAKRNKLTLLSQDPHFTKNDVEYNEFTKHAEQGIASMFKTAKTLAAMKGLDARYTKLMEFGVTPDTAYLRQVKPFLPKVHATPRIFSPLVNKFKHHGFRTYGTFDLEAKLIDETMYHSKETEPVALVLQKPSRVPTGGFLHQKHIGVVIYETCTGIMEHADIPYFLNGAGVAIGNGSSRVLSETSMNPIGLTQFMGKKVRLKSDGHYLYIHTGS